MASHGVSHPQLAVEAEVLQVIARTRTEIKAIRAKYAATRAARIPWMEPGILCTVTGWLFF